MASSKVSNKIWTPAFEDIKIITDDGDTWIEGHVVYRKLSIMDWFRDSIMNEVMDSLFNITDGYTHEILYHKRMDLFKVVFKQYETDVEYCLDFAKAYFVSFMDEDSETYDGVCMDPNPSNREGYITIYKRTITSDEY
jgi:hypothetical protein